MTEFKKLVKSWNLEFFTAEELLTKGASNGQYRTNTDPPEHLWNRMKATAKVADEARRRLGSPVRVLSAYRSPKYNQQVGGAKCSQHKEFTALDLQPTILPAIALYEVLATMRREGFWKGGLGRYNTFVHIDTRGFNASWG